MPAPPSGVATALVADQRTWSFRYEVVALDRLTVLRAVDVEKCTVACNDLADKSKRTCTVRFGSTSDFDQLSEYFRPYAQLLMPDGSYYEWPLGLFTLSSATRRSATTAGDAGRNFVGYDLLLLLDEEKLTDRFVDSANNFPTTSVEGHLTYRGLDPVNLTPSTKQLPASLEWAPGVTVLKLIDDTLATIGYRPLHFDELGAPVVEPYVDPSSAPIVWAYTVDSASVIVPGVDATLDLFNVPNRWTAFVSEPDRPPLVSTYTNVNPSSPTSTVSRGRVISQIIEMNQTTGEAPPVDQATLDARVLRAAQESSQIYEDVEFTTGLMPFHGSGDVFTLDVGDGPLRYREHTWEMDLQAGGQMKHRFRRVVAL